LLYILFELKLSLVALLLLAGLLLLNDEVWVLAIFFPDYPRPTRLTLGIFDQKEIWPTKIEVFKLLATEIDSEVGSNKEIISIAP
jgi:hypothetical protein